MKQIIYLLLFLMFLAIAAYCYFRYDLITTLGEGSYELDIDIGTFTFKYSSDQNNGIWCQLRGSSMKTDTVLISNMNIQLREEGIAGKIVPVSGSEFSNSDKCFFHEIKPPAPEDGNFPAQADFFFYNCNQKKYVLLLSMDYVANGKICHFQKEYMLVRKTRIVKHQFPVIPFH